MTSAKMLGGAGHHEHRALSFSCLECCDGSVSMEGASIRRRSSVERERERERDFVGVKHMVTIKYTNSKPGFLIHNMPSGSRPEIQGVSLAGQLSFRPIGDELCLDRI